MCRNKSKILRKAQNDKKTAQSSHPRRPQCCCRARRPHRAAAERSKASALAASALLKGAIKQMKMPKKPALALLALCLLLAPLPGCAAKRPNIVFFIYDVNDTFISEAVGYIKGHISPDFSYEICYAGNSQSVQNQQIADNIGKADLFVINAVDRLACNSIVEKCEKVSIPVIFFNREPLRDAMTGSDVFYVGAAADSLGKKQADIVASLFGRDFKGSRYDRNGDGVIQLVIIKGEQGHQDAEKRTDNCVSRLRELGYQVEVLAIQPANWQRQQGRDVMRQFYEQYGSRIELVFSNNDDMALGAIDYLLADGVYSRDQAVPKPFVIVGVDGTAPGLRAVREGLLYGTVDNDSARQAEAILALAARLLARQSPAGIPFAITNGHYIYVDGDTITQANILDYPAG